MRTLRSRPMYANVISTLCLFIVLGVAPRRGPSRLRLDREGEEEGEGELREIEGVYYMMPTPGTKWLPRLADGLAFTVFAPGPPPGA